MEYLLLNKAKALKVSKDYYFEKIKLVDAIEEIEPYWNELQKYLGDPTVDINLNPYELDILLKIRSYHYLNTVQNFFEALFKTRASGSTKSVLNNNHSWINQSNIQLEYEKLGEWKYFVYFLLKKIHKRGNADILAVLDYHFQYTSAKENFDLIQLLSQKPYSENHLALIGKIFSQYIKIQTENGLSSEKMAFIFDNDLVVSSKVGFIKHQAEKAGYILSTPSHNGEEFRITHALEMMKIDSENNPDLKIYLNTPIKPSPNNELNSEFKDIAIMNLLQILNRINDRDVENTVNFLNQNIFKVQFFGSNFGEAWNSQENKIDLIFETIDRVAKLIQTRNNNWLKTMPRLYQKNAFRLAKLIKFTHRHLNKFRKNRAAIVVKKFEHSIHKIKPELNTEKEVKKEIRAILKPEMYKST